MLYSVDAGRYIKDIPHGSLYRTWVSMLSEDEINAIHNALNQMISADEIHTSSWLPGKDWSGTPFMPIYEKACAFNEECAAMCFGLFLWDVLMNRQDVWGFGRYYVGGEQITGMTYFRLHNPPPLRVG
jgi:hypothetical protein